MNKSKKIQNLFNINTTTENIPLNHSVIIDIDKYLKENKLKRNLKKSEKISIFNKNNDSPSLDIKNSNLNSAMNLNSSIEKIDFNANNNNIKLPLSSIHSNSQSKILKENYNNHNTLSPSKIINKDENKIEFREVLE